jgi:hypothetical protein
LTDEEAAKMEVGTYSNAEFFEDVMQVTEYAADKKLTNILVDQSYATARWLTDLNVKWILSTSTHAVKMGGKVKFPSGRVISVNDGGLGLVEMLFPTAENKASKSSMKRRRLVCSLIKRARLPVSEFKQETEWSILRAALWCWPPVGSKPIRKCARAIWARGGI